MDILNEIKVDKQREVAEAKSRRDLAEVRRQAEAMPPSRGFARAVRGDRPAEATRAPRRRVQVIAEVKKASPSAGLIRADFDPAAIARSYERGGAAAISCLTDEKYFQGSLENLTLIRENVALPVLRKEFIIDPYQVWEARAAGADAILLIAGMIDWPEQRALREAAREAGMDVLIEIHCAEELAPALELAPDVLGINNRNLRSPDLATDLATTRELAPRVPPGVTLISESGIRDADQVRELAALGVDAILVGEHLMRQPDPGLAIAQHLGIVAVPRS